MTDHITWRRPSACDNAGACIEIAYGANGIVLMRASSEPEEIMHFPAEEWNAFIDAIRAGEFDHHD